MTAEVLRYAAFTDRGRGGNPAGLVLDATGLDEAAMLRIAADVGYSETAFLFPSETADPPVLRYFSPRAEVAFCGHATVALGVALADRDGPGDLVFRTPSGDVRVDTARTDEGSTATLESVPTRTRPAAAGVVRRALEALGWEAGDLDPAYPVHVAFGGVEHLVVATRDPQRLADLDYDYPALEALMAQEGWTTVHAVHAVAPDLFRARDPFPPGGVVEDPATGAAAAAFGGYLRALGMVRPPARVTVLQGEYIGRPSRLLVDVAEHSDRVRVTGFASVIPAPGP
jgi:PhzF family phenazine biosynthesis protein